MKRIYNKVYHAAMAALMLTAATACTGDNEPLQNDDTPKTTPLTTVTATQQGAGTQTRTGYEDNSGTIGVTWVDGDQIHIGPAFAGQQSGSIPTITNGLPATYKTYTIESGQGSKNATFKPTDGAFEVPSGTGTQYIYALYGNKNKIQQRSDGYAVYDITGQRQKKNGDMTHIAEYDFMYARAEYKEGQTPNFEFHHVTALLKFDLTLPESNITVKELKLAQGNTKQGDLFNTIANYRFINSSPGSSPGENKTEIILQLGENGNGFTCSGTNLTAYMMAFVIQKTFEITLTVTGTDGKTYSANITGQFTGWRTEPGKLYTVTATLTKDTAN